MHSHIKFFYYAECIYIYTVTPNKNKKVNKYTILNGNHNNKHVIKRMSFNFPSCCFNVKITDCDTESAFIGCEYKNEHTGYNRPKNLEADNNR